MLRENGFGLKKKKNMWGENMSECQHPTLFIKNDKFYCRTCGEEVD